MKKIYPFFQSRLLFTLLASFFLTSSTVFSQSICGGVVENFDNTMGSTAGFTGEFMHGTDGADGFLIKNRVIASGVYSITTPTYQLPAAANFVGFGFVLDGTEKVARVEAKIIYVSTLNDEMTTVILAQFVPAYNPNTTIAEVCRAVSLTDLPGFPEGGRYRFRFELTPNTGSGVMGQTVTFDDFRTNGTMAQAPLPVSFIGFDAKKQNNTVQLTWKVAGEENVARYEVERSTDGRTFTQVATVEPGGKDTYNYTDATHSSIVYYRIKNVDNDGKYKYSTIARYANGRSDIIVKAFPQPVLNQLTLQHPNIMGRALLTISSADGRIVRTVVPGAGSMQTNVDMSNLKAGMYMLRFDGGDGNVQTLKVIKQ